MIPRDAQGTVNKWIEDGMSRKEAIAKWESFMYVKLPEIVKPFIKDVMYDTIREMNLDQIRLEEKK